MELGQVVSVAGGGPDEDAPVFEGGDSDRVAKSEHGPARGDGEVEGVFGGDEPRGGGIRFRQTQAPAL